MYRIKKISNLKALVKASCTNLYHVINVEKVSLVNCQVFQSINN